MLGFRALFKVLVNPLFHAAAARLVGVLGVVGSASSCEVVEENGSEDRNEWEGTAAEAENEVWIVFLVLVTKEFMLSANRLDFRGGSDVRFGFEELLGAGVKEELLVWEEVMLEIDIRRIELG